MIKSREEYKYVSITSDILIDGGIMPVRDVAGDGSWQSIRGEDIAFCLEAVSERCVFAKISPPSPRSVDKHIYSSRWTSVIDGISRLKEYTCIPGVSLSSKEIDSSIVWPYPKKLSDAYAGILAKDSLFRSNKDKFYTGAPLLADPIRDVFRDIQAIASIQTAGTVTKNENDVSYEGSGPTPIRPVLGRRILITNEVDRTGNTGGGGLAISSGGTIDFNLNFIGMPICDISKSTLISIVHVETTSNQHEGISKYYACVSDMNEDFSSALDGIVSDTRSFLESNNLIKTFDDFKGYDSRVTYRMTASISEAWAILNVGSHTDFSNIKWSYSG